MYIYLCFWGYFEVLLFVQIFNLFYRIEITNSGISTGPSENPGPYFSLITRKSPKECFILATVKLRRTSFFEEVTFPSYVLNKTI